jgi:hypothetical protein
MLGLFVVHLIMFEILNSNENLAAKITRLPKINIDQIVLANVTSTCVAIKIYF